MAATVGYLYAGQPSSGFVVAGATAPTQAQSFGISMIVATVQFGDADTTATLTHNWQLSATQNGNGWPTAIFEQQSGTVASGLGCSARGANTVTLIKNSTATGSGGTHQVTLLRPHTVIE